MSLEQLRDLPTKKDVKGGAAIPGGPVPGPVAANTHHGYDYAPQDYARNGKGYWWYFMRGFNVGHVIIILGMLSTAVWWFVNYDREITITKFNVSQLQKDQARQDAALLEVDKNGTHGSQAGIQNELGLIRGLDSRITNQEQLTKDFVEMKFHLQVISDWVEEQKKRYNAQKN